MVQIVRARLYDVMKKEWLEGTLPAAALTNTQKEQVKDGALKLFCPDGCCSAELEHRDKYSQTFYDDHNQPYKLDIPTHFKRKKGSLTHHPDCEVIRNYVPFQRKARSNGALATQGTFIYNLNIQTSSGQPPIRRSTPDNLSTLFAKPSGISKVAIPKQKFSQGIQSIEALAEAIDGTYHDYALFNKPQFRYAGRKGVPPVILSLEDLYFDDPVSLLRSAHDAAQDNRPISAAILFKPIKIKKFWHKKLGGGVIYGQAKRVTNDAKEVYYVSIALQVRSEKLYKALEDHVRQGNDSFLIYSDEVRVDRQKFAEKKAAINDGTADDRAFHVDVPLNTIRQIMPWTPPTEIKSMDFDAPPAAVKPAPRALQR